MNPRILVVAQDVAVRAKLARLLIAEGWAVELAEGMKRAREIVAEGSVPLAILIPDRLDAAPADLATELRQTASALIVIAERPHNGETLGDWALDSNTFFARRLDDEEILTLARTVLHQSIDAEDSVPTGQKIMVFDELTLDVAGHSVLDAHGCEISVTRAEFALLFNLARHPGQVLSRDRLLTLSAGRRAEPFDRSIDVMISRLRRKIEPDPKTPSIILTIPGVGYKFAAIPRPADEPMAMMDRPLPQQKNRRVRSFAGATLIASVLAFLAGSADVSRSYPELGKLTELTMPAQGHWINGAWVAIVTQEPVTDPDFCVKADLRCRKFVISSVGGDGNFNGAWGYQAEMPAPAYVKVSGQIAHITTATDALIDVRLDANGMLSGTLVAPRPPNAIPIVFRKVGPPAEAGSDRDHWINGNWVGIISRHPVTDPNFCEQPDIRCRTFAISNVGADGTFSGVFAYQGRPDIPVNVTVLDQSVQIDFRGMSYIKAHRDAVGRLSGVLVMPQEYRPTAQENSTNVTSMVTLRKLTQ